MKSPNWALPLLVIAFIAVRIFVSSVFRRAERRKSGKGWFESIPMPVKVLWVLLAIAVVVLLIWSPTKSVPAAPGQSADPAPASGTPPAGHP